MADSKNEGLQLPYEDPVKLSRFEGLVCGISTREGGFSKAPFDSLNLSFQVGDSLASVRKNRNAFFDRMGVEEAKVVTSRQVHGSEIAIVQYPGELDGFDALITNQKGIFLGVMTADCAPVLIYDPVKKVVAVVHAGWKGSARKLTAKTLEKMKAYFNVQPKDCHAYIGTCISRDHYEVDDEVARHFSFNEKRFDPGSKRYFVDIRVANQNQLKSVGVPADHISLSRFCTFRHNDQYFSYRRSGGETGRMMALIGMPG